MVRPTPFLVSTLFNSSRIPSRPSQSIRIPTSPSRIQASSLHSGPIRFRAPPVASTSSGIPPVRPTSTLGSGLNSGNGAGTAGTAAKKKSAHIVWYREIVPAMLPILLLSTTLFLLLALSRTHLSSERTLAESQTQIAALEQQLAELRQDAKRRLEKERRERERMLPLVVERVLTKVGAMRGGEVEEEEREREEARKRDERERALLA